MKKNMFMLLAMMAMVSCQGMESMGEEPIIPGKDDVPVKGVQMHVPAIVFDEAPSKSAMTVNEGTGLTFTWSEGDATGVYSTTDGFARFNLVSGDGMSNATFDGGGFSLTDGSTYYAFFPYEMSASDKTAIPLVYSGQIVTGDNDLVNPMTKDYLWASAVSEEGNASFSRSMRSCMTN